MPVLTAGQLVFVGKMSVNSVLLLGSDRFTTSVIAQVRGLDALTVMPATTAIAAGMIMARSLPDIVIAQASQLIEGSVIKTFDQSLQGTYFIVVEEVFLAALDGPPRELDTCVVSADPPAGMLTEHTLLYDLSDLFSEKTAAALESGADAYLWLTPAQTSSTLEPTQTGRQLQSCANSQPETQSESQELTASVLFSQGQQRLAQAYLQVGLARAQRHHNLSRIHDWLSAIALVDSLTQISNRRAFDLELPRQIQAARTRSAQLSLLMLDIDYFKQINDRYGHPVGDDVLKQLAKRLLNDMRFYDTPFRYGGEEFVVILSNTDLMEAWALAERLRQTVAETPFALAPDIEDASSIEITVSIGLTELRPDDDDQGQSCLRRADQNLLRAKALGRNQVVSA